MSLLFDQSTFESMAKKYTAFHLGGYEDEELLKTKGEKVSKLYIMTKPGLSCAELRSSFELLVNKSWTSHKQVVNNS